MWMCGRNQKIEIILQLKINLKKGRQSQKVKKKKKTMMMVTNYLIDGCLSKENENTNSKRYLHSYIH